MASTSAASEFHCIDINDTHLCVLNRYENLRIIGSGAQGVVWYEIFHFIYQEMQILLH